METIEYASSKKSLEILEIPNLPKNIAAIPKPDKQFKYLGLSEKVFC